MTSLEGWGSAIELRPRGGAAAIGSVQGLLRAFSCERVEVRSLLGDASGVADGAVMTLPISPIPSRCAHDPGLAVHR
jgi:hypothetical protein